MTNDFTELRKVVAAAVRYEAARHAYSLCDSSADRKQAVTEYNESQQEFRWATLQNPSTTLARFALVFDRLDALERVAEAAERQEAEYPQSKMHQKRRVVVRYDDSEMQCEWCGKPWPCATKEMTDALDALHRQEAGEQ